MLTERTGLSGRDDSSPPDLPALLRAASDGDESAWREVVGLYARRVFALARSRCRRHDVAEEITQSVFVTVATKLTSGEGGYEERDRFEPWLFRIAMNRIRDEIRRAGRHAEPMDPSHFTDRLVDEPGGSDGADDEQIGQLRAAVAQLSESDREVIELRHHADMSFREMADMLDQPIGTLLARHHRALKKLKAIMEDAENNPSAPRSGENR